MSVQSAIQTLREVLRNTPYEGQVYLVGGYVRDKLLKRPLPNDLDLVLEGDGPTLAKFLYEAGITDHEPVLYPRFGTAMVHVKGVPIEIVTARAESYHKHSRKPAEVQPATLKDDALRRDFTVNTLLENLHTGEIVDPVGLALSDLQARLLRTPLDPKATFYEDPLRMLRAIRFAVQLDLEIEAKTYEAIREEAARLQIISKERIRDEFTKVLEQPSAARGLQMFLETGLLARFAPELLPMVGCEQNIFHRHDVWEHTLRAVDALPPEADWQLRLAMLLHDVGKPHTKTVDEEGEIHFYRHQDVGAGITHELLKRLRYPKEVIERVSRLVLLHMRPGEYHQDWTDAAVRRLMREVGDLLEPLLTLVAADASARRTDVAPPDLEGLKARIQAIREREEMNRWQSPLSGKEIMHLLNLPPGPLVGKIKNALTEKVIEGELAPDDKATAEQVAREIHRQTMVDG